MRKNPLLTEGAVLVEAGAYSKIPQPSLKRRTLSFRGGMYIWVPLIGAFLGWMECEGEKNKFSIHETCATNGGPTDAVSRRDEYQWPTL